MFRYFVIIQYIEYKVDFVCSSWATTFPLFSPPPHTPISYRKIPLFSLLSFPLKLWHAFTGVCADFMGPFPVWYMALQPISHQGSEKELLACLSTVFHCLFWAVVLQMIRMKGRGSLAICSYQCLCFFFLLFLLIPIDMANIYVQSSAMRMALCLCPCIFFSKCSSPTHKEAAFFFFCLYAVLRWKRLCEVRKRKRPWEGLAVLLWLHTSKSTILNSKRFSWACKVQWKRHLVEFGCPSFTNTL